MSRADTFGISMGIARIILVAFVALSVAMLPAVASALAASQPAHASMSDDGGMPCKKANDGKAAGCCVLMCFNFLGAIDLQPIEMSPPHTIAFSSVDKAVHPHPGSPPTRPPTI